MKQASLILDITNGGNEIPGNYSLMQNYPNPFNPSTSVRYTLKDNSSMNLTIYNSSGKEMQVLVNERQEAGIYEVHFDGSNYPSGIYYYKMLVNGNIIDTKRMVLIK